MDGPSEDVAEIRRIRQAVQDAENEGDARAFAALFTNDVGMLPASGEPIHGADRVEAFHRDLYAQAGELDVRFTIEDIVVLGGIAVEHGTYTFEVTEDDGQTREGGGRYLYTYERSAPTGTWRIHRMSWG